MYYLRIDEIDQAFDPSIRKIVVTAYQFEKIGKRVSIESAVQDFLEPLLDSRQLIYYTNRYEDYTNITYNGQRVNKLRDLDNIIGCKIELVALHDRIFDYDLKITGEVMKPNWVKNGF